MSRHDLSRVDLVVNIRFPGPRAHAIQVAAMAEALAATGLNVDVVVPRRFPSAVVDPWEHYAVRRTFGVQRLANLDSIDLVPPRWQRAPFLLQSLSFAWRALARAAVERDAGVLVRDHYTLEVLVTGLRARDRHRLAAEVHNLPAPGRRRSYLLGHLARLPAVIAISGALRDDLIAGGVESEAVLLARDGVHLHRYADLPTAPVARAHLGLPERPTVVYAGQLYPWKGVDTLVRAMVGLPEAQLLIVGGEKELLYGMVKLARELLPGRCHFTGNVPPVAVPFHLAAGDVIALPNSGREEISARYTSPLKLFEAMACRRPIVASDLSSLREVLEPGRNAQLVAADDPGALAAGLSAVLSDRAFAGQLAAQAVEDVVPYDWATRGRQVADFLRARLEVGA
ncbi:MAG: glycosyltransferase family 4 protein [Planctomycetota bacterium]|jgi:glycosyltransferase involved in cell wall biosynthesis